MTNKIIEKGWYLLSGIKNLTCKEIITDYGYSTYLDISAIYIPLYRDFSENTLGFLTES